MSNVIQPIIDKVTESGISDEVIILMKKARPYYIDQTPDPLVARLLRMTYEHIEKNNDYKINFLEESEDSKEQLNYLLSLLTDAKHHLNREELQEIKELFFEVGQK